MAVDSNGMNREIDSLRGRNLELESALKALQIKFEAIQKELVPFHILADNIPDWVFLKDVELKFKWVNRNMYTNRGMASRDELVGKTSFDLHPLERAKEAWADDQKILTTGEPLMDKRETDFYLDGSKMWVLTTKVALRDSEGKIIGICGISKDITKMVLAEHVLSQDGALRNDLLENIPDGVWFKDRESRFTWVNKSIVNDFGMLNRSDIIGKTDYDFFPMEHANAAREDEIRIMETNKPILNHLERDNYGDGTPRWVYTTKIPIHDSQGQVIGTCGVTKDVTTMKKAEEALALESNLLNAMLNNIPDAIYFKDNQSRFVRVSRGIHLEGLKNLGDAIGKTDFDFFAKAHAEESFRDEQEIMRTGIPIVDKLEREVFTNDRPDAWVTTTKVPVFGKDGSVTGLVGISRDVSERIAAQEAIRKAKEDLEVRVQERTAALVQEIKEHLRTERALREGEKMLQEANLHLESRVGQLHFLNSAAHKLAHFPHRKDLLPAIVDTFVRSHPGIEAAICEIGNSGYECGATSARLFDSEHRRACAHALSGQGQNPLLVPILIPNRKKDSELSKIDIPGLDAYSVYLALPLLVEETSLAVVQIFGPPSFLTWYEQENVILNTLAAQAAISLSNANNFLLLDKEARIASELEVAQAIQRRFTPQDKPLIPRVDLKGVYFPAKPPIPLPRSRPHRILLQITYLLM